MKKKEKKRKLSTRLNGHRKAVEKNDPLSNIVSHANETGHHMNINDTKILYRSNRLTQRLFLESWATNDNTINRCKELSNIYENLFKLFNFQIKFRFKSLVL